MKKYTFLIYHNDYERFLLSIRDLGVLHIEEKKLDEVDSPSLKNALSLAERITNTQLLLSKYIDPDQTATAVEKGSLERGKEVVDRVEQVQKEIENIQQQLPIVQKEIDQVNPWGNFDFSSIERLKEAGYKLDFFICPQKDFDESWKKQYEVVVVNKVGVTLYFVIVSKVEEVLQLNLDAVQLGQKSLHTLQLAKKALEDKKIAFEAELQKMAKEDKISLELYKKKNSSELEFSQVILSGEKKVENKLILLKGWLPVEQEAALNKFLDKECLYYDAALPTPEDNVPIQLKNTAFTKLFEPITKMFSLPNYTELDPTPFLAPFFMLFFGLCMGDGGYGILIFLASWYFKKRVSDDKKSLCQLGQYLGIMTIVVGILTGSFFGIAFDSVTWGWLAGVKEYFVTQKNYGAMFGGYHPLMVFAIVIGVVQILFGMCLSAAKVTKQHGFAYAKSIIAWVVLIITAVVYFGMDKLGVVIPEFVNYFFYFIFAVAGCFIYLFNTPGKNIIVNIATGLWNTYNMATGLLGDSLSYIRLFALGLTGSILGGVFNNVAFDLTASLPIVPRFLLALFILLFGHIINFGLCMISAFVHPLRLTFVEFYKNAEFEGGGKAYKPFKKQK